MARILLVEDEMILREAFTILLTAQGYSVEAATNGQEALDYCHSTVFDLILLDLMMPVLDGVGFLQQANLTQTHPRTRVVILSNLSSGAPLTVALELGAHRHAIKANMSPKDIIALVEEELSVTT